MFAQRFMAGFKKAHFSAGKGRKLRVSRVDLVSEQVKEMLQNTDQKLILMVRS